MASAARQDTGLLQWPPATCIRILRGPAAVSGAWTLYISFTVGFPGRDCLILYVYSQLSCKDLGRCRPLNSFCGTAMGTPSHGLQRGEGTGVAAVCFWAVLAAAHGQAS